MLEEVFQDVYTKFKLHFYQNVFQRFATREATLTTVESFCMEGIMAMGEPTIAEFSRMMGISTPNANTSCAPPRNTSNTTTSAILICTRSSSVRASASRLRTATRWSRCSRSSAPS